MSSRKVEESVIVGLVSIVIDVVMHYQNTIPWEHKRLWLLKYLKVS